MSKNRPSRGEFAAASGVNELIPPSTPTIPLTRSGGRVGIGLITFRNLGAGERAGNPPKMTKALAVLRPLTRAKLALLAGLVSLASFSTSSAAPVPAAPSGLAAQAQSSMQIALTWIDNSTSSNAEDGF